MQRTTVRRIGNGLGVLFPKAILDHLHLEEGTEVNVTMDADHIVLSPVEENEEPFDDLVEEIFEEHDKLFRELSKR